MAGILTHEQKQLAFRLRGRGWRLVDIAREVGCTAPMVGLMVRDGRFTTGVPDDWEPRSGCLSIAEREPMNHFHFHDTPQQRHRVVRHPGRDAVQVDDAAVTVRADGPGRFVATLDGRSERLLAIARSDKH